MADVQLSPKRYMIVVEPIKITTPRLGVNAEKQTFRFPVKLDRVYHDVRFVLRKGFKPLPSDDPRLRKTWLFESTQRRFASELQGLFQEDQLDPFLFKSTLGNFYDLDHRVGERIPMDQLSRGMLFCTERVNGGFGRIFIARG